MGRTGGRAAWVAAGLALVLAVGLTLAWVAERPGAEASVPRPPVPAIPAATAIATPAPTPSATPTPPGFPANTAVYDLEALPSADVFAVNGSMLVDDAPYAPFAGETATPLVDAIPVFADPLGDPVARLHREFVYGGTTVPVVQRQDSWVKVLLPGRQSVPSQGNPGQVAGWLRAQDVALAPLDTVVEVSISARTVDVWRGGSPERIAGDFAWGRASTPTPLGRSFVMLVRSDPSLWYTRGHPIVYLSVQSPTLDGFGGSSVAVTAFHYHDDRSGQISNGCLRLDPAAIERLAQLPVGTPVFIRA
ncbi:L,D-transpeptidase [Microbacterium sp. BK668]|uniref:L,D-transpeptidase n=1 Tax=Microbacterium sp. BK668 TaxID=2512118 RepID=UPI00105B3E12|nr:L,D-transpeptidase [Microbacterium sp. BK668]TDN93242.1 L,D-transpeptidase-like protein [Microbacterium sp. BK668]